MTSILLVISGILFGYLMGIRTGLFHSASGMRVPGPTQLEEKETWLNIYQEDQKIGYAHRKLEHQDTGFQLTDFTRMRLNTMGLIHTVEIRTTASLFSDLSLDAVDFSLKSHRFSFHAVGRVKDNVMIVTVDGREIRIALEGALYVTAIALDAVNAARLKPGDSAELAVFDPSTFGRQTIRVTAVERESLRIMERDVESLKVRVEVMGTEMNAWLDKDGAVLQEKGMLGFTLKQVTPESALDGEPLVAGKDLTRLVSVSAGKTIETPERLSLLKLTIDGVGGSLFIDGDRQEWKQGILTVLREPLPDPEGIEVSGMRDFLMATPFMESDHPDIMRLSADIVSGGERPLEKAQKLVAWVHDNIEKRPVISVPSALETLKHRQGDCNEHAVLLAAMARASGIPAQVEAGLVYLNGRFYYHAWNVLFLGRWITADALMNQMPADVTHLRLVRGDPSKQVDLMGTIGRISLNILDETP
ncbi:MAG: transglutaminase-like domain-containing protein [Pseudomonadota bacterium]